MGDTLRRTAGARCLIVKPPRRLIMRLNSIKKSAGFKRSAFQEVDLGNEEVVISTAFGGTTVIEKRKRWEIEAEQKGIPIEQARVARLQNDRQHSREELSPVRRRDSRDRSRSPNRYRDRDRY